MWASVKERVMTFIDVDICIIVNVVLHELDLHFQGQTLETANILQIVNSSAKWIINVFSKFWYLPSNDTRAGVVFQQINWQSREWRQMK